MRSEAELISELRRRYQTAEKREVVTAIHLFGIECAADLEDVSVNTIAEEATGHKSYGSEIRKGMRLARFVDLKGVTP